MPDYAKQLWADNDATKALSAARMTHIENGIFAAVRKDGGSTITASAATVIPLVAKGAASQSANLFEAHNDVAGLLAGFRNGGHLFITPTDAAHGSNPLYVRGINPAVVVGEIRAAASQTANIFEFQASTGAGVLRVEASGRLRGTTATGPTLHLTSDEINITTQSATSKGLTVRGAASQTAPIMELSRSDGAVLLTFDMESGVTSFVSSLNLNIGSIGMRRVQVGGPDSAGAGFRTVRVAN